MYVGLILQDDIPIMDNPNKTWWNQEDGNDENMPPTDDKKVKVLRPKSNKLPIIGSVALVLALAAGLVTANFTKPNPYEPRNGQFNSVEYPATIPAIINECGAIFNFTPDEKHYGQFPKGFFDGAKPGERKKRQTFLHPMIVPAYGYMSNNLIDVPKPFISPETTNIPKLEEVLRLMWDGWTVIWYVPPGSAIQDNTSFNNMLTLSTLAEVEEYANSHPKTIALPWTGEKPLPAQRNIAFSQWGTTQSCAIWNADIVDAFKEKAKTLDVERTEEPPYATLGSDGELNPIVIRM